MCCGPGRCCACPRPRTSPRWHDRGERRGAATDRRMAEPHAGRPARLIAAGRYRGRSRSPRPRPRLRLATDPPQRRRPAAGAGAADAAVGGRPSKRAAACSRSATSSCRNCKQASRRRAARELRRQPTPRPRPASSSNPSNCSPTRPRRLPEPDVGARSRASAPAARDARCDGAVARVAGPRLADVAVAVDRPRRRRVVADGAVVRAPPAPGEPRTSRVVGKRSSPRRRRSETRDATERMRRQGARARRSSSRSSTPQACAAAAEPEAPRAARPAAPRPRGARRSGRRNAIEPNGHQSRPGGCRCRGRLPHRVRPVRSGRRARAEGARGGAGSPRSQAQAARSIFHVGQQGRVPESRARVCVPKSAKADDADWNKVVIMGRQICPDERLFSGSDGRRRARRRRSRGRRFAARSRVRRSGAGGSSDRRLGQHGPRFEPRELRQRPAPKAAASARPDVARLRRRRRSTSARARPRVSKLRCSSSDGRGRRQRRRTTPGRRGRQSRGDAGVADRSSGRAGGDWATVESPTAAIVADAPTVETPTIESRGREVAPTMATKTVASPTPRARVADRRAARARAAAPTDYTAEIDLDDLGLDVKDIEGLPGRSRRPAEAAPAATRTRASSPRCATTTRCCRRPA